MNPNFDIRVIESADEINITEGVIGLDLETSPRHRISRKNIKNITPDPYLQKIVLAQIAVGDVVYILKHNFKSLVPLLENSKVLKVIHNASFEYKFCSKSLGAEITPLFDVMLAEAVLESGRRPKLSLKAITYKYLQVKMDKSVRERFIDGDKIDDSMLEYAALDAWVLPKLYKILKNRQSTEDYPAVARVTKLENKLIPAVAHMELDGITLDRGPWTALADEAEQKKGIVSQELLAMLPVSISRMGFMGKITTFNLNSRDELLGLFDKVGLCLDDLDAKTVSTTLAAKRRIADRYRASKKPLLVARYKEAQKHFDILTKYSQYSLLTKATSTYGYKFLRHINPVTGRVHQRIRQVETRTGRFAGNNPNLMNIPKDVRYRKCFVAMAGHKLIIFDYSQQELRILAEFSLDAKMIEAFETGIDFHLFTARLMFRDKTIDKDDPRRAAAKGLNFGLIYGMGPVHLADILRCSVSEAKSLMREHAQQFPNAFIWLNDIVSFARTHGYVETLLGRRRYLDTSTSDFERQAKNTPIQSSGADMTKLALIGMYGRGIKVVNVVHDETVSECPNALVHEQKRIIETVMLAAAGMIVKHVPFKVDGIISREWVKK